MLGRLVDGGNTVVVIEHNLDVIKTADWVIDMGPEGGFRGGQVVATGTPEDVARVPESHTGHFLAEILRGREVPLAQPELEPLLAVQPAPAKKRGRKPADAAGTSKTSATKTKRTTTRRTPAA